MTESAPPPTPESPTPQRPSSWPKAIGIISIVFGALALLGAAISPLTSKLQNISMQMQIEMAEEQEAGSSASLEPMQAAYDKMAALQMKLILPTALAAILLLVGGIWLVRRKPKARPLLIAWAIFKIGVVIFVAVANAGASKDVMMAAMEPAAAELGESIGAIGSAVGIIGAVIGILWGCALPVFMLIWFLRKKITAEVSTWA